MKLSVKMFYYARVNFRTVEAPGRENVMIREKIGSEFEVQNDQYSNKEIKGNLYTDYLSCNKCKKKCPE